MEARRRGVRAAPRRGQGRAPRAGREFLTAASNSAIVERVDKRIEAALTAREELLVEGTGAALGIVRRQASDEVAEQIGKLRAEVAEQIGALRGEVMARVDQAEAKVASLAETVGELTARVAELEDELHAGLASFADIAERARHACRLAGLL